MFRGVHNIGVGVSNMDEALDFYSGLLGFSDVLFDYSGPLPGMEKITGKAETNARVVMLANPNMGNFGIGMIRLVELLAPDKAGPMPEGIGWGELGVSEVCVQTYNTGELMDEFVGKRGIKSAMDLCELPWEYADPETLKMSYLWGPDNGKIEFNEIPGLGNVPKVMGVYHVAFGCSDADTSADYYRKLGFTEELVDFTGVIEEMNPWFGGKPQDMRLVVLGNFRGAGIELVQQFPEIKDCRGEWGHVGPMDFQVEVTNMEKAIEDLETKGIKLIGEPQAIEVESGVYKYAFLEEPDGNYVSLIEQRF